MAMVRGNVSVHLSDHSEIDMADKGNHTDVTNGLGSATVSREPRKLPKLNGGAHELHYVSKSFARNGLVIMLDNVTATLIVNVLIDFELVVIKV